MLEIFRGLRKFLDTRNISDSDVPPAKGKGAKFEGER
jgi:hypothetical protein